jgi:hypothetical protein
VRDRDHNDACYIISPVRFASVKKRNRKLRMIDDDPRKSFWHSEKGKIPLEGSKSGGYVQDFVQAIKGTDGHTERLGWRMKETRSTASGRSSTETATSIILCKVYRMPRNPPTASTSATPATRPAEDVPVYSDDPAINSKKRKPADGDCPDDSRSSARPRLTEEYAPLALSPEPESAEDMLLRVYCENLDLVPEPESAQDELFDMCRPVIEDKRIRAAMPNAPDPLEDKMQCLEEEFVKKTVAEVAQGQESSREKKKAQPEPERGGMTASFRAWNKSSRSCIPTTATWWKPYQHGRQRRT